jgi:hypothetical protein
MSLSLSCCGFMKSAHADLGVVENVFRFTGQAAPVLVL